MAADAVEFWGLAAVYSRTSEICFQLSFIQAFQPKEGDQVLLVSGDCKTIRERVKSLKNNRLSPLTISLAAGDLARLSSRKSDEAYQFKFIYVQDDVVVGTSRSFTLVDRDEHDATRHRACDGDFSHIATATSQCTCASTLLGARQQLSSEHETEVSEEDVEQFRGSLLTRSGSPLTDISEASTPRSREMRKRVQSHSRPPTCYTQDSFRAHEELNVDENSRRASSFSVVDLPSCNILSESEELQQAIITKAVAERNQLSKLLEMEKAVAVKQQSKNEEIKRAIDIEMERNRRLKKQICEVESHIRATKMLKSMKGEVLVSTPFDQEVRRDSTEIGQSFLELEPEGTLAGNSKHSSHDTSLLDIFSCPVCFITFGKERTDRFQRHVQSHFEDDDNA